MLKTIIDCYLQCTQSIDVADKFSDSFDKCELESIETEDLQSIETGLSEITGIELLSVKALKELSEYRKALTKELKKREEEYF
jgi:hypothetical protein